MKRQIVHVTASRESWFPLVTLTRDDGTGVITAEWNSEGYRQYLADSRVQVGDHHVLAFIELVPDRPELVFKFARQLVGNSSQMFIIDEPAFAPTSDSSQR